MNKPRFILLFLVFVAIIASTLPRHIFAQERASASSAYPTNSKIVTDDKRVRILRGFLASYDSPLAQNASSFVKAADEAHVDWRLLAAISGVESTFGKQIPNGSYNAWGWGIYGNNAIYFASWDEGINTISKSLRENYINKIGTDDVYAIGRLYAASPTWAARVERFMGKISDYGVKDPASSLSLSL